LGQDFTGAQVAAETLVTGGAKTASDGASGLGGNAQGAPIVLGNKDRLDGIAIADIKQPLDGAVTRDVLGDHGQGRDVRVRLELLAQRLGQIAHQIEVGSAPLVNPAEQLGGSKTLFAQTLTKNGQTIQIKFKKVGRHGGVVALEPRRDQRE